MVDEAKLCGPICSTFEVLVVQCVVGRCQGEEFGASRQLAEHTSQM